jgi:hypothetical protein
MFLLICFVGLIMMGGTLTGCETGGSTLGPPGPGPLLVDASADRTVGYGYLSTSFFVNVVGGNPPYMAVWDFGDNSDPKVGIRVSHCYEVAGQYIATVIVYDTLDILAGVGGNEAHDSIQITIFASGV